MICTRLVSDSYLRMLLLKARADLSEREETLVDSLRLEERHALALRLLQALGPREVNEGDLPEPRAGKV